MNVQVQRLNHVTAAFANKLDRSRGKVHHSRNAKAEQRDSASEAPTDAQGWPAVARQESRQVDEHQSFVTARRGGGSRSPAPNQPSVAQRRERRASNSDVVGSNPTGRAKLQRSSVGEQSAHNALVAGSIPAAATIPWHHGFAEAS